MVLIIIFSILFYWGVRDVQTKGMKEVENILSAIIMRIVSVKNHPWMPKLPSTKESCLAQGYPL